MASSAHPGTLGHVEVARPNIEAYHLAYAEARRPRVSWQDLGRQLHVNAEDLRRHYEGTAYAPPAAAPPAPAAAAAAAPAAPQKYVAKPRKPVPPHVTYGSMEHQVLSALGGELTGGPKDVALELDRSVEQATWLLANLQRKGLVAKPGRFEPCALTPAGAAELKRVGVFCE